jgi:hypothetical protein
LERLRGEGQLRRGHASESVQRRADRRDPEADSRPWAQPYAAICRSSPTRLPFNVVFGRNQDSLLEGPWGADEKSVFVFALDGCGDRLRN